MVHKILSFAVNKKNYFLELRDLAKNNTPKIVKKIMEKWFMTLLIQIKLFFLG